MAMRQNRIKVVLVEKGIYYDLYILFYTVISKYLYLGSVISLL